ncbi:hypothetical protein DJ531_02680, partial [Sulfolobus sp. A20-N-F6]
MSQDNNEQQKKTITIRGIDEKLYRKLSEIARNSGKTVGEVTNQAFKTFIDLSNTAKQTASSIIESGKTFVEGFREGVGELITISDIDELIINKEELMSAGKPIVFKNIKRLTLTGITDNDIDAYIREIYGVDELIIPSGINKIKLL